MIHAGSHAEYFCLQGPAADLEDLRNAFPEAFAGQEMSRFPLK